MIILPTEKRFDWKHAPVVLFIIILLNIVIYFGYQFGDNQKAVAAVMTYKKQNFLSQEWPIYRDYLTQTEQLQRLKKEQAHYAAKDNLNVEFILLYGIVADADFYYYLDNNAFTVFDLSFVEKWASPRRLIQQKMQSVSSNSYGLIPNKISLVRLISYQFLHASIAHLLGNLFFLIVVGFAVEAAIGHVKFLGFYLLSGVVAGLSFAWTDLSSTTPLVGASGSISAVMAMYLGVFRFKKIEFFYWFFVFVGYFRAPAMLILPVYIGKELYDYYTNTGSNVAFMAHAGGFVAGAVLMMLAYLYKPNMLNQAYIEEDQDVPKLQKDLDLVYGNMAKFRFASALKAIDAVMLEYGVRFEWLKLRYLLLKMQKNPAYKVEMAKLLSMPRLNQAQIQQIYRIWINNPDDQSSIDTDTLFKFAWMMTSNAHIHIAEQLFQKLYNNPRHHPSLSNLAKKLAVIFEKKQDLSKKSHYLLLVESLADEL